MNQYLQKEGWRLRYLWDLVFMTAAAVTLWQAVSKQSLSYGQGTLVALVVGLSVDYIIGKKSRKKP